MIWSFSFEHAGVRSLLWYKVGWGGEGDRCGVTLTAGWVAMGSKRNKGSSLSLRRAHSPVFPPSLCSFGLRPWLRFGNT